MTYAEKEDKMPQINEVAGRRGVIYWPNDLGYPIYRDGNTVIPLAFAGWAGPALDGTEEDTYSWWSFFDEGIYLGPDEAGTYPLFAPRPAGDRS